MIIGVPKELKPDEYRVAVTPAGVRELVSRGHSVIIETEAGVPSSLPDDAFTDVGADIVPKARDVFDGAELIVKVKEPQESEVGMLGPNHTLFTFLHLAAYPKLISALTDSGATAIAYETVQLPSGSLPLLAPMSEIAGRLAAQSGAHYLERPRGGRGILIGGVSGVAPARVTVLGAGMAGTNAAKIAAGMGAEVIILDLDVERLRHLDELHWGRLVTVRSSVYAVEEFVSSSDMVIGAVLIPGGRAPRHRERRPRPLHATRERDRRHLDRPGRLHRDVPRDHPRRPRVPDARRHPLCGWQHPGCGSQHGHLRPHQRHASLPGRAHRRDRPGAGVLPRAAPGYQRRLRQADEPDRRP